MTLSQEQSPSLRGRRWLSLSVASLATLLVTADSGQLTVLGFGMGLFQTPNNNLLMSSLPRQRLGVGSSFLSIVRSLGNSVGAAPGGDSG